MEKKSQILEILGDGSWHDREQLSAQLGISGSELEAQLDSLRRSHRRAASGAGAGCLSAPGAPAL